VMEKRQVNTSLDTLQVSAGAALMIAGSVVLMPIDSIRRALGDRPLLRAGIGLSLVAGGLVLVSRPMLGPILDGKYFGWPPIL